MTLIENKKAHFDYEIVETYEAGASLVGHEVKALRAGKGSLEGARVGVRGGEAFLIGATIQPYQVGNTPKSYDPERTRKLLLSKKEIVTLADAEGQKGLTIVPLKWYNHNRKLKLAIAIARHKKKYDKRASLKERDTKREIGRTLKNEYR
jgi:SsrA-binding protein